MIYNVQILRGLAALAVIVVHLQPQLSHYGGPALPWLESGGSGVDLFFVISGFIIWTTTRSEDARPLAFLKRRFIRVVPLYWSLTAVVVAVALVMPSLLSSTVLDLRHLIASILFIPWQDPVLPYTSPILVPGWSLQYELFFYLLFSVGLLSRDRMMTGLITVGTIVVLVVCGLMWHPTGVQMAVYTDPLMMEFVFGIGIGMLYTGLPAPSAWLSLTAIPIGTAFLVGLGVAGLADDHQGPFFAVGASARLLFAGVPAALVVWGATAAKRRGYDLAFKPLVMLGDTSYSLYLTQVMALPAGAKLWHAVGIDFAGWRLPAFMAYEMALVIVVGIAVCRCFERPMLTGLRDRFESRRDRAVPAARSIV